MSESERRYQQLIRTSPAPINLFDADGQILWGNDAVIDLLGLASRADLIGRSIFEFIQADDRYTAEAELAMVVEEQAPTGPTEMKLERVDGEIRTVRVATAPGRYDGEAIGQAVVIDITDQQQTQAALERERQFVEDALDTIDDVFYVIAPDGSIVRWNQPLIEVSGYDADDVAQMHAEDFFIDAHVDRISKSVSRAFAEGADVTEAIVETKTGAQIPYEFRKRRLETDDQVIGVVGIGRDVSERKTREYHLQAVDYMLQHQLRNRLNIIQGRAALLESDRPDPEQPHAEALNTAADEMLELFEQHRYVVDLLTSQPTSSPLDISSSLRALLNDYQEAYPDAELRYEGPESVVVSATPAIETAIRNLVERALDQPEDATPRLTVSVQDGSPIELVLTDNAPPIPHMEYTFIEDPDSLDATNHPSGLGLWAVYIAVSQSRGTLTVTQPDDTGNRISIELPSPPQRWD